MLPAFGIVGAASFPCNLALSRAQEFPAGWRLAGIEDGDEIDCAFFLNAANNS